MINRYFDNKRKKSNFLEHRVNHLYKALKKGKTYLILVHKKLGPWTN